MNRSSRDFRLSFHRVAMPCAVSMEKVARISPLQQRGSRILFISPEKKKNTVMFLPVYCKIKRVKRVKRVKRTNTKLW